MHCHHITDTFDPSSYPCGLSYQCARPTILPPLKTALRDAVALDPESNWKQRKAEATTIGARSAGVLEILFDEESGMLLSISITGSMVVIITALMYYCPRLHPLFGNSLRHYSLITFLEPASVKFDRRHKECAHRITIRPTSVIHSPHHAITTDSKPIWKQPGTNVSMVLVEAVRALRIIVGCTKLGVIVSLPLPRPHWAALMTPLGHSQSSLHNDFSNVDNHFFVNTFRRTASPERFRQCRGGAGGGSATSASCPAVVIQSHSVFASDVMSNWKPYVVTAQDTCGIEASLEIMWAVHQVVETIAFLHYSAELHHCLFELCRYCASTFPKLGSDSPKLGACDGDDRDTTSTIQRALHHNIASGSEPNWQRSEFKISMRIAEATLGAGVYQNLGMIVSISTMLYGGSGFNGRLHHGYSDAFLEDAWGLGEFGRYGGITVRPETAIDNSHAAASGSNWKERTPLKILVEKLLVLVSGLRDAVFTALLHLRPGMPPLHIHDSFRDPERARKPEPKPFGIFHRTILRSTPRPVRFTAHRMEVRLECSLKPKPPSREALVIRSR